jgi:hypothetical protein
MRHWSSPFVTLANTLVNPLVNPRVRSPRQVVGREEKLLSKLAVAEDSLAGRVRAAAQHEGREREAREAQITDGLAHAAEVCRRCYGVFARH